MKSITLLLAYRYLWHSSGEKNISTMVHICFLSILIGTFSLALVSAIMNGFEKVIYKKMQGIHANVIIRGFDEELNVPAIQRVLNAEFPEVVAISPNAFGHAIIQQKEKSDQEPPKVIIIRGIDPEAEAQVSTLEEKIIRPRKQASLPALLRQNRILIGRELAEELRVDIDSPLTLLHTEQIKRSSIKLSPTDTIIGGIFNTGIEDIDSSVAFCSLSLFQSLFPETGIVQINLKLTPDANEEEVIARIAQRLDLAVYSWQDLYPALVSALKLEKWVMFFILTLITLVASMNIISLMFMFITQKRPDIAILKSMGCPDRIIQRIFLAIGMSIAISASAVGLLGAYFASKALEKYPFISLPDVYFVSHLPARMDWDIMLAVLAVVVIVSFIATVIPTRKIRSINISHVLRYEG